MFGNREPAAPDPAEATLVARQSLADVLRSIYASTLYSDCWSRVMRATAPVIGTGKVMFIQVDRLVPSSSATEAIGLAPEHL